MCAQTLSVMQQQSGDEEAFEYNSMLRHGIFEAYSGILNGMSQPKCDQFLRPFVPVRLHQQPSVLRDAFSLKNHSVKARDPLEVPSRPPTTVCARHIVLAACVAAQPLLLA